MNHLLLSDQVVNKHVIVSLDEKEWPENTVQATLPTSLSWFVFGSFADLHSIIERNKR